MWHHVHALRTGHRENKSCLHRLCLTHLLHHHVFPHFLGTVRGVRELVKYSPSLDIILM